jgi:hypothetical protein
MNEATSPTASGADAAFLASILYSVCFGLAVVGLLIVAMLLG